MLSVYSTALAKRGSLFSIISRTLYGEILILLQKYRRCIILQPKPTRQDYLVLYAGHSLGVGSYPFVAKQSVYSTVTADWATRSYIHFRTNTIGKGMNPPIPTTMGYPHNYLVPLPLFYKNDFSID